MCVVAHGQVDFSHEPLNIGEPGSAVDYAKPYGELNFFDVSAFLARFADQVGDADLSWDGEFNFFDISTFLQLYAQGCPDSDG